MDHSIVLFFNQLAGQSAFFDSAVIFFANYFPYLLGLAFVVCVSRVRVAKERWWFLAQGLLASLIARGGVEVFRLFVHRPRPFVNDPAIIAFLNEASYSFPSGHASFFFALSTVVYLYNKRWGIWFYVASTLIGFARIVAGVHYPTDILGGAVLGIGVGLVVHRFFRKSSGSSE